MKKAHFKDLLFIHIPKNAGSSVSSIVYQYDLRHKRALDYPDLRDKLSFAVVRNPWDRIVSSYFFLRNGGINKNDREDFVKYVKYENFSDFVKKGLTRESFRNEILEQQHFRPQSYWICDDSQNIIIDYIAHFESIKDDLDYLFKMYLKGINFLFEYNNQRTAFRLNNLFSKLGIGLRFLPVTNQSHHRNYKDLYDDKMVEIVNDLYDVDCKKFNYSF